jgi:hypothetical protein
VAFTRGDEVYAAFSTGFLVALKRAALVPRQEGFQMQLDNSLDHSRTR